MTHVDRENPHPAPAGDLGFDLPRPARVSAAGLVGAGLIAAVLLGGAFAASYLPRRAASQALEQAAEATRTALPTLAFVSPRLISNERALRLPGSVQPLEEAVIYPRANGYVSRWFADLGAKVKEGALLAEIDTPELDQELSQARAAHAKAVAVQVQADATRELAKNRFDRAEKLVDAGIAAVQDLEQAQAQAAVGDADVNVARANVAAESANIRKISDLREFAKVVAPFSGTITARNVERGSLVTAGNATPLFRLAATDTVRVFVQVPQDIAPSVSVGAAAVVTVREFPERKFEGHVAHTSGALDSATRTLTTEVRIDNADGQLLSGMYAEVNLTLPSPRKVYELPSTALATDARGVRVAVIGAENRVHFVPVVIERDLGATVLIASGLAGSERIAQIASADLEENQRVNVVPAKLPPAASGSSAPPAAPPSSSAR
ncbi:MAG TPA: efflux RND transporter periplasmic adaptor subunit [Polyangiaceae bacterium]